MVRIEKLGTGVVLGYPEKGTMSTERAANDPLGWLWDQFSPVQYTVLTRM